MFDDLDMGRDEVRAEVGAWGEWVIRALPIDGFRLDAVRHIRFPFFVDWLDRVRGNAGDRQLFAVGEYFSGNVSTLRWFIEQTGRRMSLFDFPLHFNMRDVARGDGVLDMQRIFDGTLVAQDPTLAVTFVDNHDTWQEDRRDEAIRDWFLPHAYALILLREGGYPCIFHADYYGGGGRTSMRPLLDALLAARRDAAYGPQTDYFDDGNLVGWTRAGDAEHPQGMAVVLSDGPGGIQAHEREPPKPGVSRRHRRRRWHTHERRRRRGGVSLRRSLDVRLGRAALKRASGVGITHNSEKKAESVSAYRG